MQEERMPVALPLVVAKAEGNLGMAKIALLQK